MDEPEKEVVGNGAEPATGMRPGDEAPPDEPSSGENFCPDCQGSGTIDGEDCPTCGGAGVVNEAVGGG